MTAESSETPPLGAQEPSPPTAPESLPLIAVRADEPIHKPLPKRQPIPRFGSAHLFLWIACTAAYLAANKSMYRGRLPDWALVLLIAQFVPRGAAWAGLAIFVRRRWRGAAWPIEPGEWLVAITGAWLALETLLVGHLGSSLRSPQALLNGLTCLLLVMPTLTRGLNVGWKLFFSFAALLFAWPLLAGLVSAWWMLDWPWLDRSAGLVQQARLWLLAVALAAAVYHDRKRGLRRGWLHWAGLGVVTVTVAMGWVARLFV